MLEDKSKPQFLDGRIVSIVGKKTKKELKPYAVIRLKDVETPIICFNDAEEILARYKRGDLFDAEVIHDDKFNSYKVQAIGASFYKGKKKVEKNDHHVIRCNDQEKIKEFDLMLKKGFYPQFSNHPLGKAFYFSKDTTGKEFDYKIGDKIYRAYHV